MPNLCRTSRRLIQSVLLSGFVLSVASAEQTTNTGGGPPLVAQPGLWSEASFGEIVAGEFTGDLGIDVVVMDGDTLRLCMTPETYRTSISWSAEPVLDLAVHLVDGDRDRLIITTTTGLREMSWDETAGTWNASLLDGAAWAGASAVAVGELNGLPGPEVAGLMGVQTQDVIIKWGDGAGGFDAGHTQFQTTSIAYDVVLADWDGDGTDEVFVTTAAGVEGFEPDGTPIEAFAWTESPVIISPLDDREPGDAQSLAMLLETTDGVQVLLVWSAHGLEPMRVLYLRHAVSMDTTDVDGDGDSDLWLGLDSGLKLLYVPAYTGNQRADPADRRFDAPWSPVPYGDSSRDPSLNGAGLCVADFDHDGQMEVMAPSQGSYAGGPAGSAPYSELCLIDLDGPVEESLRFEISGGGTFVDTFQGPEPITYYALDVEGPSQLLVPGPGQQLLLHATLWETPEVWVPTLAQPVAIYEQAISTTGEWFSIRIENFDTATQSGDELFSWVVRQVVVEGDQVVQRGPARVAVTARGDNEDYLPLLGEADETLLLYFVQSGGTSTPDGGMAVGGTIPEPEHESPPDEGNPRP